MKALFNISILILAALSNMTAQPVPGDSAKISGSDSLVLSEVIKTVIASHPSVKEAEEALTVADARINIARSGYMPDVDVTASYSNIGPAPSLEFPNLGKFQLFPNNNYAASLNYHQTLYDFGKTANNVKLERESKNMNSQNIDLVKQRLSLATVNSFYNLVFLQEAIRIKNDEIKNLQDHLGFIEKKRLTGSATSYEILTTKVRISNTQSQRTDLETMQQSLRAVLNALIGIPAGNASNVKQQDAPVISALQQDSLLSYAYAHRIELAIAKEKEALAGLQYNIVKSQNNPVLSAQASVGGKNGYVRELEKVKANYVVGLGLRVPLFDGNRKKNNLVQVQSSITNATLESDIAKRNISSEVIDNEASQKASFQKIGQYELQLDQAREAYKLAQLSFETGAITNLDLLDAETRLSESTLQLLKAKIDYSVAVYRLKTALGDKLY